MFASNVFMQVQIHTKIPVILFGGVLRRSGDRCSGELEQGKSVPLMVAGVTLLEDGESLIVLFVTDKDPEPSSSSSLSSSIFLFRDFVLAMGEVSSAVVAFTFLSPLDLHKILLYILQITKIMQYARNLFL